jgi:hypothetical protein
MLITRKEAPGQRAQQQRFLTVEESCIYQGFSTGEEFSFWQ